MIDVREKPEKVERAFLIGIQYRESREGEPEELLEELEELVDNLDVEVVGSVVVKLRKRNARFLLGTGKLAEINEFCHAMNIDVIVFDDALSPSQQRNWEKETGICCIDRREVILDIFAGRATTKEAVLQISLARAEYDLPRLTNAWTHLSRQRGAVNQKGEGESQLELDRRMVRKDIQKLRNELVDVRRQRETQRKQRRKRPVPNAALVGYTNAGKSSLLNVLTGSDVYADDKLFATLDPTTKKIVLENNQDLLLTDTVGFIRKLPHDLVEAFKATLEEAVIADFLIHVVDVSNPDAEKHMETTLDVLEELGGANKRIITVFNKIDIAEEDYRLSNLRYRYPDSVFISVKSGVGIDALLEEMCTILNDELKTVRLKVPMSSYETIALLHRSSRILTEEYLDDDFVLIEAGIPPEIKGQVSDYILEEV